MFIWVRLCSSLAKQASTLVASRNAESEIRRLCMMMSPRGFDLLLAVGGVESSIYGFLPFGKHQAQRSPVKVDVSDGMTVPVCRLGRR